MSTVEILSNNKKYATTKDILQLKPLFSKWPGYCSANFTAFPKKKKKNTSEHIKGGITPMTECN